VSALEETTGALSRFAALALEEWDGLPACTLADVEAVWRPGEAPAREVPLGAAYEIADARRYDAGPLWVRVWSRGDAVVLLDVEGPFDLDPSAFGEPEARLAAHAGFASYPDGELVYGDRGLVLGVSPESGVALYAAVFAPCSVQEYVERLRIDRVQRPMPLGGMA
jgi:hypothetical protein